MNQYASNRSSSGGGCSSSSACDNGSHSIFSRIGNNCFVKWFYFILIMQTFCMSLHECRQQQQQQQHQRHNNNNNNRQIGRTGDIHSIEYRSDISDEFELDHSFDVRNNAHAQRRGLRKKHHNNNHHNHNQQYNNYHNRQHQQQQHDDNDISLWINEQQLKMLSALFFPEGYSDRIYAIENGHVLNDIRDMSGIYKFLVIPSEVNYVNFTWKSGKRKYFYNFDRLQTLDDTILKAPTLSIKTKGRIPQEEKNFSIFLPCTGNNSGTAMFNVGLSIENRKSKPLPGTPIRLNFKKECAHRGVYDSLDASNPTSLTTSQEPDPECKAKCGNGFCNHNQICQCKAGYTGQYCQTAFCFPQCMNGGNCTAPSICTCPDGYQGTQCEGGICTEKCLNGGKCIQKDKCQCSKGYYGLRCEYSRCVIPCKNGGRCIGNNKCRCPNGLGGNHCEIGRKQRSACKCKHGRCLANKTCKCEPGYHGRYCHGRIKKHTRFASYS